MMVMMWAAEWPLAQFTSAGELDRSSNPFIDYHLIYALAADRAGRHRGRTYFGLGRWWARVTSGNSWLR